VTAKGVETAAQLAQLRALKCEYGQVLFLQAGGLQGCKSNISSPAAVVLGLAIAPRFISNRLTWKVPSRNQTDWELISKWKTGIVMEQIKPEVRQRVQELRQLLQRAAGYYVLIIQSWRTPFTTSCIEIATTGNPVSRMITADSPTQRVGEKPATQFPSVRHKIPYTAWRMLSTSRNCRLGSVGSDW